VGASGCGKTTFLRMLLGTEQPTRGRIRIDGNPIRPEPDPQRGVVFQRYSLFPRLTVMGNLLLDEPFGALDPGITADMHDLILKLWRENGMTIFMISHDIQESFKLGTRLLTFDRLRHDPQSPEAYGASITYDNPLRPAMPATA
jgi:NitT/TauT family transport system ATP-binding protein